MWFSSLDTPKRMLLALSGGGGGVKLFVGDVRIFRFIFFDMSGLT